ncbi:uncharacterized protein LOC114280021 [Camellia sinensis]|uniref:uncharacterized protein LOC114280021 n=1 Tax=Camellia sinensis TaxID=4442 RepID=UPI0010360352|nr:uncharacterized protein LOC114280021 [Camellia sinensis]
MAVQVVFYAYGILSGQRILWESLSKLRVAFSRSWCIGGDCNEIRFMSERKWCIRRDRGMKDFNGFIDTIELMDLPMLGRSFTWCNDVEGERWSRLNRFLLDVGWLEKFSFKQWGLNRSISDHCPVIIMTDERDWGPKPFRCINAWSLHPNFVVAVKTAWDNCQVSGWASYRIMKKLGHLRGQLRIWNSEVFGNVDENRKKDEDELHEWDLKAESRDLQEFEKSRRREVLSSVWDLKRKKENMWQQKSRLLWAENGDKNSRFFHMMSSRRQRKNLLNSVAVNGSLVVQPNLVKQAVVDFFREVVFREEEIWVAVKECDENKALGPDGFNLACF